MDADLSLLTRLVGDVDRFAAKHWGQRSLLRASGTGFEDLLSVATIEELLVTSARRPTFRLVQNGSTLPPDRSTRTVRLGGQPLDDVADLGRIAVAVDDGATLVLQSLQRTSLHLAEVCHSLERATSHPVQANAYLTPAGATGLARHHDDHDVLVLQVVGTKAWEVEDLGPVRTQAGDVLYIPAGVPHEASAQHGPSLHLTLGLLRITHAQVVRRALHAAEGLDRPLPLGYARPERAREVAEHIRSALAAATAVLEDAEVVALADREIERARSRRAPVPLGQLRSVLALDGLDATSMVARRMDQLASVHDHGRPDRRITLQLHDRRVQLPAVAAPALDQLLTASAVQIGALRGLDAASQIVLATRLIREGLLVVDGG